MATACLRACLASLILAALLSATAEARDRAQVRKFRQTHPCPATGLARGACPGWEVDHRKPLKCGGADLPANMQWLTIGAHRAKTRREAPLCRPKK